MRGSVAASAFGIAVASCLLLSCQVPRALAKAAKAPTGPTYDSLFKLSKEDKHEALRQAVDQDDPELMKKLVKQLRWDGMTPKDMFSTDKDHFQIISIPDSDGYSLLHYAAYGGTEKKDKPRHVRHLIEAGVAKDLRDSLTEKGQLTPLMIAGANGNAGVVRELLQLGVNPRQKAESPALNGPTFAARAGHVDVIRAYMEAGGRFKNALKDRDGTSVPPMDQGWAPIEYAVAAGNTALVDALTFEIDWGKIPKDDVIAVAQMQVQDKKLPQDWLDRVTMLADRKSKAFKEEKKTHTILRARGGEKSNAGEL